RGAGAIEEALRVGDVGAAVGLPVHAVLVGDVGAVRGVAFSVAAVGRPHLRPGDDAVRDGPVRAGQRLDARVDPEDEQGHADGHERERMLPGAFPEVLPGTHAVPFSGPIAKTIISFCQIFRDSPVVRFSTSLTAARATSSSKSWM